MANLIRIGTIINSTEALDMYRDAVGDPLAWPPPIPDGCNTFWSRFTTADGRPAIIIQQRGFKRRRGEGEVNGFSVVIALDMDGEAAFRALDEFVAAMLPPAPGKPGREDGQP